jgi:hypothetical protein
MSSLDIPARQFYQFFDHHTLLVIFAAKKKGSRLNNLQQPVYHLANTLEMAGPVFSFEYGFKITKFEMAF